MPEFSSMRRLEADRPRREPRASRAGRSRRAGADRGPATERAAVKRRAAPARRARRGGAAPACAGPRTAGLPMNASSAARTVALPTGDRNPRRSPPPSVSCRSTVWSARSAQALLVASVRVDLQRPAGDDLLELVDAQVGLGQQERLAALGVREHRDPTLGAARATRDRERVLDRDGSRRPAPPQCGAGSWRGGRQASARLRPRSRSTRWRGPATPWPSANRRGPTHRSPSPSPARGCAHRRAPRMTVPSRVTSSAASVPVNRDGSSAATALAAISRASELSQHRRSPPSPDRVRGLELMKQFNHARPTVLRLDSGTVEEETACGRPSTQPPRTPSRDAREPPS